MTAHRRPAIPFSDAPRGTCRWCGEAILVEAGERAGEPNLRRRWHPACVDVYNATDPREARKIVRKRDRGICAVCRLDTKQLGREIKGRGRAKRLRAKGFVPRRSLWELDHIVPLIDGGSHALENLQTLCTPCHKAKTAEEARTRPRTASRPDAPAPHSEPAPESEPTPEPVAAPLEPAGEDAPTPGTARSPAKLETLLEQADAVNARIEKLLGAFKGAPKKPSPGESAASPPIR